MSESRIVTLLLATAALTLTVLAGGCRNNSTGSGALSVIVRLAPAAQARCVMVIARPTTGVEQSTGPILTAGRQELKVAIFPGDRLTPTVTVFARGFADDACLDSTQPPERSEERVATFAAGQVTEVVLELVPDRCVAVTCAPPPSSCHGAGVCNPADGGCSYAVNTGQSCSDGNSCTVNDACEANGGCAGALVSCTPPSECFAASETCEADGGCRFYAVTGKPCDGGFCGSSGACHGFVFTPSNFLPSQLLPPVGPTILDCGESVLDSTAPGSEPTFTNWCGQIPPHVALVQGSGVPDTLLFSINGLGVDAGSTLRIKGERTVILAVLGDAVIQGHIEAGARMAEPGPGGGIGCDGVSGTGTDGGTSATTHGGGGGGGFGTPGAVGGAGSGGGAGGDGGMESGQPTLVPLRGGCAGGYGGGPTGGAGGAGGGGLQISATGTLSVSGWISSSGGGGGGAQSSSQSGGGGGGSGGGLLLEAELVSTTAAAALTANGGGGGEGSENGKSGYAGAGGYVDGGTPAPGGDGPTNKGGVGGAGGALNVSPDAGTDGNGGGGGGGGGGAAGRIRINAGTACSLDGGVTSPAATGNDKPGCPP